jgi:hypothetical protein
MGVDMKTWISAVFDKKLDEKMTLRECIELLNKLDLINIGEMAEKAVSIKSNIPQCKKNSPDIDLVSGVQIKAARVTTASKGHRVAYISIKKVKAPVLALIVDFDLNREYYYYFPYDSFKYLKGNTISLSVGNNKSQWNVYGISSFEKLCSFAKNT